MNLETRNRLKRLACEWVMLYHYLHKAGADDAEWAEWFDKAVAGEPLDESDENRRRLWRVHVMYANIDLPEILKDVLGAMELAVTTFNPELDK